MTKIIALAALAILIAMTSTAFAQEEPRTRFYEINPLVLEGEVSDPLSQRYVVVDGAKFNPLRDNLRKSFMSNIQQSADEMALD